MATYAGLSGNLPAGLSFGKSPSLNITGYSTPKNTGLSLGGGQYVEFAPTGTTAATTSTAPTSDPNQVNQYNQALSTAQAAYNRLAPQFASAAQGLDTQLTDSLNQLLGGYNVSKQAYDTSSAQTNRDYVSGKNSILSNAGSTLHGLLRLLGSRGAGGGSAYSTAIPQSVARNATLQRNDLANQYAQNENTLNTNWGNYENAYKNSRAEAQASHDRQLLSLQNQNYTDQANNLLQQAQDAANAAIAAGGDPVAASQSYIDRANSLLDQSSHYSVAPISYSTAAYNAPSLASYTTTPTNISVGGQAASDLGISPYLSALLGKKQLV